MTIQSLAWAIDQPLFGTAKLANSQRSGDSKMTEKNAYAANVVAAKLYGLVGSPIELVLGNAMFALFSDFYEKWWCRVYSFAEMVALDGAGRKMNGGSIIAIVPQFQIPEVGRVDFAMMVPQFHDLGPLVIVECDGHEFHERTPEQASKDRKRDRVLTMLGLPILRFTGADILRDSAGAAEEIAGAFHQAVISGIERWNREIGDALNKKATGGGFYVPFEWPPLRRDRNRE